LIEKKMTSITKNAISAASSGIERPLRLEIGACTAGPSAAASPSASREGSSGSVIISLRPLR
jgi:hypothetical protein